MKRAPLRFLFTILILWIGVRAAILLPGGPAPAPAARPQPAIAEFPRIPPPAAIATGAFEAPAGRTQLAYAPETSLATPRVPPLDPPAGPTLILPAPASLVGPKARASAPAPLLLPALPALQARPTPSRWSLSAWLLVRDNDGAPSLVPGGVLGGSQAGARLTYALGGGLSLSGRFYLPLRRASGAELAAGIDWRPVASLPVSLLAERRQRLGRDGRNAFALTLYGGVSRNLSPRLRLDTYAQAGIVGLQSRDLFADGLLRLSRRVGPVEFGAGAWGAAQPGAARLDAGPSLSWRLPVPTANLRLQADWRFRIAGDAAPRSGPALTLATDF
jgi:hypothetical protein